MAVSNVAPPGERVRTGEYGRRTMGNVYFVTPALPVGDQKYRFPSSTAFRSHQESSPKRTSIHPSVFAKHRHVGWRNRQTHVTHHATGSLAAIVRTLCDRRAPKCRLQLRHRTQKRTKPHINKRLAKRHLTETNWLITEGGNSLSVSVILSRAWHRHSYSFRTSNLGFTWSNARTHISVAFTNAEENAHILWIHGNERQSSTKFNGRNLSFSCFCHC